MTLNKFPIGEFWTEERDDIFHATELGRVIKALPRLRGTLHTSCWIAGGAVRRAIMGEPLGKDVDIFFQNASQFAEYRQALLGCATEMKEQETDRRVKFLLDITLLGQYPRKTIEIDLVKGTYFPDVEALLKDFDFTCCCVATDGSFLYATPVALFHLGRRILKVNNQSKLRCSLDHMERYLREGFTAERQCLNELLQYGRRDREEAKTRYSGPDVESNQIHPAPPVQLDESWL